MNKEAQENLRKKLNNLLIEFVAETFRKCPVNLTEFAAKYFESKLCEEKDESNLKVEVNSLKTTPPMLHCLKHREDTPLPISDKEDIKLLIDHSKVNEDKKRNFKIRRASVSGEPYDPEKDKDYKKIVIKKSDGEKSRLINLIKSITIFKALDDYQVNDIVDAMQLKLVKKDEIIIEEGAEGDYFYVIETGVYQVFTKLHGQVFTYNDTGYFGELALLYNVPRAATVIAKNDGKLWCIPRTTFRQIVLQNAFLKRKKYENLLESCKLLKGLNKYERLNIADALFERKYKNGDCIIKQDEKADCMYFVIDGKVDIIKEIENQKSNSIIKSEYIKTCMSGDYFGEHALINNEPRIASAYARSDNVVVGVLDKDTFHRLIGKINKKK